MPCARGSGCIRGPCCNPCFLTVVCVVFMALAVLLLGFGDSIIRHFIQLQLPLDDPTRLVFKVWSDTEYDGTSVVRKIWMYSCTNPEDVYNNHAVPDFLRRGPYVYREHMWLPQEDIYYAPDGTVGFKYIDTLTFDPTQSIDANGNQLSENDVITSINFPFLALLHRLAAFPNKDLRFAACLLVDVLFGGAVGQTGLFVQRTVNETLFGYEDPLFAAFNGGVKGLGMTNYSCPTRFNFLFNGSLPGPSPWTAMDGQKCPVWDNITDCNRSTVNETRAWAGAGWGVPLPRDPDESVSQYTAAAWEDAPLPRGVSDLGSLMRWADQDRMWWWGSPEEYGGDCQVFQGGTGMTYPPLMDVNGQPYVYIDSMYRKMRLAYQTDGTVKGIPVKRFVIDKSEIDFGPNSGCYFQQYKGLYNITPVVFAPLVVSGCGYADYDFTQPLQRRSYTYPGDERLALNITIDGRRPQDILAEEYESLATFLDVFNDAGMLMQGAARLQTNTWLQPPVIDGCEDFFPMFKPKPITNAFGETIGYSYFPETLVPAFYLSREALISDSVAAYVRDNVLIAFTLAHVFGGVFCACALLSGILAGVVWVRHSEKHTVSAVVVDELHDGPLPEGDAASAWTPSVGPSPRDTRGSPLHLQDYGSTAVPSSARLVRDPSSQSLLRRREFFVLRKEGNEGPTPGPNV
jgi:hypothetical protein